MASKSTQIIRQVFQMLAKGAGYDRVMSQAKIVEAGAGRCVAEMTVAEEHTNKNGTLHGGLTATLVDTISTCALMTSSEGKAGVSVDMNITYMRAAKMGETIVVDASTLKMGKALAFLSVDITNKENGKLLAQGRHTKHIGS